MVSILFVRVRKTDQDAIFYGNILKACKKNKNYSVAYYGIYPCCQWNVYRIIIIFKGSEYKHIATVSQDYFFKWYLSGLQADWIQSQTSWLKV